MTTYYLTLSTSQPTAPVLAKQVAKAMAASQSAVGSLARRIGKRLSVAQVLSPVAVVTPVLWHYQTVDSHGTITSLGTQYATQLDAEAAFANVLETMKLTAPNDELYLVSPTGITIRVY